MEYRELHQLMNVAERLADASEYLWGVVANVSGGDWTKQSEEWQSAAAQARDQYLKILRDVADLLKQCNNTQ